VTVEDFNRLPRDDAARALLACCSSQRWVEGVLTRRPFASVAAVLTASDAVWRETGPNDWYEALAGHPRIGERTAAHADERARRWSVGEQGSVDTSDADTRAKLARANREYEARFGHIFVICATGKSAAELLAARRARMHNSPDVELAVAAEELRKIARLRLTKLLGTAEAARS
jgi:2-oxo-4-hydroxy-4-carboxy-5-ureidoimidazoline decarboxylase